MCLSSLAVPGLNGFVGEFLIMLGSWSLSHSMVALASMGVVLAAGYVLWMVQRVLYGEVTHAVNRTLPDLSAREFAVLIPLVVLAIVMGVASPLFTRLIEPSVESLVYETNTRMRKPLPPTRAWSSSPDNSRSRIPMGAPGDPAPVKTRIACTTGHQPGERNAPSIT